MRGIFENLHVMRGEGILNREVERGTLGKCGRGRKIIKMF
jgi:hypothetical protein